MQKKPGDRKIDRTIMINCIPGASLEKDGVRFTLSVPEGAKAYLLLYEQGEDFAEKIEFPEKASIGSLRTMKVHGLRWKNVEYQFCIGEQILCDPYAKVLAPKELHHREYGYKKDEIPRARLAFGSYDWKNEQMPCIPYEDAVMYHLHVRNFTKHERSGVRHKGTFRGITEKIPYFLELGINQLKLMPVYENAPNPAEKDVFSMAFRQEKKNYWGYGNGYYFALNRTYASSADAVKEFKDMVCALHQNGIEVILEMYFAPSMTAREMLEILTFWVKEYHVDGFHLMGEDGLGYFLVQDPVLAKTKLLVNSCGGWEKLKGTAVSGERVYAECNDGFMVDARRLLKGDEGVLEQFTGRCRQNGDTCGQINYITNHDGFTLNDLVTYDNRHNEENGENNNDGCSCNFSWNCGAEGPTRKKTILQLRRKQMKNAFLLMLLSQGTPMMLAGDEFANSQNGNNNPYCLDNEVSWVDWSAFKKNQWLFTFVKKAIAFRKEHAILHSPKGLTMTDYKSVGYPDLSYHSSRAWFGGYEYSSRQIGMLYCEKYVSQEELLYIAYNLNPLEQPLALPALPNEWKWTIAADTSTEEGFLEEPKELTEEIKTMMFPARSITILIGRK